MQKTIIKYATAVNSPDIKAISIAAYERGFVVLYEETRSSLREQSLREDRLEEMKLVVVFNRIITQYKKSMVS